VDKREWAKRIGQENGQEKGERKNEEWRWVTATYKFINVLLSPVCSIPFHIIRVGAVELSSLHCAHPTLTRLRLNSVDLSVDENTRYLIGAN
jgi:hypothetical protein